MEKSRKADSVRLLKLFFLKFVRGDPVEELWKYSAFFARVPPGIFFLAKKQKFSCFCRPLGFAVETFFDGFSCGKRYP